jgi:hypothetical protein
VKINHLERALQQGMGSQVNYRNRYNICSLNRGNRYNICSLNRGNRYNICSLNRGTDIVCCTGWIGVGGKRL